MQGFASMLKHALFIVRSAVAYPTDAIRAQTAKRLRCERRWTHISHLLLIRAEIPPVNLATEIFITGKFRSFIRAKTT
jgi:hypothetical protein